VGESLDLLGVVAVAVDHHLSDLVDGFDLPESLIGVPDVILQLVQSHTLLLLQKFPISMLLFIEIGEEVLVGSVEWLFLFILVIFLDLEGLVFPFFLLPFRA